MPVWGQWVGSPENEEPKCLVPPSGCRPQLGAVRVGIKGSVYIERSREKNQESEKREKEGSIGSEDWREKEGRKEGERKRERSRLEGRRKARARVERGREEGGERGGGLERVEGGRRAGRGGPSKGRDSQL